MDWKSIADKKVAGIPVLYLAAGAVVIFAVWAWQLKSSTAEDAPVEEESAAGDVEAEADYSGLASNGTVTVVQQAAETETESVKQTNDDWLRAAVTYLIDEKLATPGEAQTAINNYLEGNDMTYEQGQLKDAAIKKLGLPPERITQLGNVGNKTEAAAQRQFSLFPGKHTVKGSNDNSAAKLAQLYYGNGGAVYANKIAATNNKYGNGVGYNVGTVLTIPAWRDPRYFTVTKTTRYAKLVGAKNGVSEAVIRGLNPGMAEPYNIGAKVRIW